MSLRNVAGLYLVRLRGRIGQELLAMVGIAAGVALLFAALVANASLTDSFSKLTDGIVGKAQYQLVARGSGAISEGLLLRAQSLPDVELAAGVLQTPIEIRGPGGSASVVLLGVTPELGEMGGPFSRGFSYRSLADVRALGLPTPLAGSLGLSLAQPVTLTAGARTVKARLGAKLQADDLGGATDSPIALAPLRYAQELTGRPAQITRVIVRVRRGREQRVGDDLRRLAAGTADLRQAEFEAGLLRQAALPTSQSTAMFSVFGAMVGFLFAFSAMLLTVPQRRRLIADLQTEGYRPRTIVKVLSFDAFALGVAASALGVVLGDQVARRLFDDAPSFLRLAFPVGAGHAVGLREVALAAAGGLAASFAAVLGPTAGSVLGLRPRTLDDGAAAGARSRRVDWLVAGGLALLAAGLAVVLASPSSAAVGIAGLVCLTASMLLLLPSVMRALVAAFDLLTDDLRGVVPFLVSFDLRDRTTRARSLAVAATGAVAVCGSVSLQGAHADLLRGLDHTTADVVSMGEVWALAPGDANLLATNPFPAPRVHAGGALASVRVYRGGFLDVGDRRVSVFGPPAAGPLPLSRTQLLDGDLATARQRLRRGGWMVVSTGLAQEHGLRPGDRFRVPSPVPTTLRVAALSTNLGWPPGAIVMNAEDYARAWGSADASALLATLAPGTTPEAGRRALAAALGPESGLAVQTAAARQREQREASRSGLARLAQISALVLVSAVIAMAAAMGGLIWQRRGFLASVKVDGYRTSEMWRALLLEAGILIGAGCGLGAVYGLLGQRLLSTALTSVTGFPVIYAAALGGALATCLIVTVAAVAIVGAFGHRAASVPPESGLNG